MPLLLLYIAANMSKVLSCLSTSTPAKRENAVAAAISASAMWAEAGAESVVENTIHVIAIPALALRPRDQWPEE